MGSPKYTIQLADDAPPTATAKTVMRGAITVNEVSSNITALKVSLRCRIRSTFYRYYSESYTDERRQTTTLYEETIVVWQRASQDLMPEQTFEFDFVCPAALENGAPLLPTYEAGKRQGWEQLKATPGQAGHWVRWDIKVHAIREGKLQRDDRVRHNFTLLPLLPAPSLPSLQALPEPSVDASFDAHSLARGSQWTSAVETSTIKRAVVFGHKGEAKLTLYVPACPLPRLAPIPFLLVLDLSGSKPNAIDPVDWSQATLKLDRIMHSTAADRRGAASMTYSRVFDGVLQPGSQTFNGPWRLDGSEWVQQSAMAGNFVSTLAPSFEHPQIRLTYALKVVVGIDGMRNDAKLASEVQFIATAADGVEGLDAPPAYDEDEADSDSEQGDGDEKRKKKFGLF